MNNNQLSDLGRKTLRLLFPLYIPIMGILSLQNAFHIHNGRNINRIWSDGEGYYLYLPAVFIHGGFDADKLPVRSPDRYKAYPGTDQRFTRYTCGVAIMQMPFFLGAHLITSNGWFRTHDPNGYSMSYSDGIVVAAVFYCMLGLWLLQQVLLKYFDRWTTFLSIMSIYFGTNMYYYTISESALSHIYSFSLFCLVVWMSPRLYAKPDWKNIITLGLTLGLITLIRPTNIIFCLFVLFYEAYEKEDLIKRFRFFRTNLKRLWVLPLVALVPFIPQFFYWHYITGNWITFSYEGRAMDYFPYLSHPKIWRVWLDVQNGLFIYSPILFFAILGLILNAYKRILNGPVITLVFLLASYIFGSYAFWWFGGAFGHRCYVEYYALLIFPLAYTFSLLPSVQVVFRGLWYIVISWLIYYSVRLTFLYNNPWDGPDWNWNTFEQVLQQVWPF